MYISCTFTKLVNCAIFSIFLLFWKERNAQRQILGQKLYLECFYFQKPTMARHTQTYPALGELK
jgi:hypothetical protein